MNFRYAMKSAFPTRRVFFVFLSSLLLILSFPKFDHAFLAWFALVPLLAALKDQSLKAAFGLSLLTGSSFFMGVCYWINEVEGFALFEFILCGIYLGSYFGLFAVTFNFVSQKTRLPFLFTAPVLWVSAEYVRSHAGFLGVPWTLLGHSQYLNLPLIQIASFTGVYGVSFLLVMVNAILSEGILAWMVPSPDCVQQRPAVFQSALVTCGILGISLLYGFRVIAEQPEGDMVSITVIQANIARATKWKPEFRKLNLAEHIRLTENAAGSSKTSLIVWPETAVQGSFTQDLYLLSTIPMFAREVNAYLLIGSSQHPKFGPKEFRRKNWFNSAFLLSPGGRLAGQYNKIHLVPFGEYLPLKDFVPWPSRVAAVAGTSSFISGKEYTIFHLDEHKFAVLICWESLFPELVRQFVNDGAEFVVNITDESWFGESAAPYQFLAMNVFRAVENRIAVVRSANTGISGFIDPHGRIIGKVEEQGRDIFIAGYLTKEIALPRQKTFYTLYGEVWAYLNLTVTFVLIAVAVSAMVTRRRGAPASY